MRFEDFVDEPSAPVGPLGDELCKCQAEAHGQQGVSPIWRRSRARHCKRTYGSDYARLLGCASGMTRFPPSCPAGPGERRRPRAAAPRSAAPDARAAAGQRCVDWQGGEVCLRRCLCPPPPAPPRPQRPRISTPTPRCRRRRSPSPARWSTPGARRRRAASWSTPTMTTPYYDVFDQGVPSIPRRWPRHPEGHGRARGADEQPTPRSGPQALVMLQRAAQFFADRTARTHARQVSPAGRSRPSPAWPRRGRPSSPPRRSMPYTDAVLAQYRTGLRTKSKAGASPAGVGDVQDRRVPAERSPPVGYSARRARGSAAPGTRARGRRLRRVARTAQRHPGGRGAARRRARGGPRRACPASPPGTPPRGGERPRHGQVRRLQIRHPAHRGHALREERQRHYRYRLGAHETEERIERLPRPQRPFEGGPASRRSVSPTSVRTRAPRRLGVKIFPRFRGSMPQVIVTSTGAPSQCSRKKRGRYEVRRVSPVAQAMVSAATASSQAEAESAGRSALPSAAPEEPAREARGGSRRARGGTPRSGGRARGGPPRPDQ